MSETLMFDFSDWYRRLAREMPNDCKILECGIANCDSVIFLAKELLRLEKKFKIYAVDNFDYGKFIQIKHCYENLIREGVAGYVEIIPKASLDAVEDFNDGYLDAVFIDSSHTYPETALEIVAWHKKVKDEGIVSGHDYNAEAVNKSVHEVIPNYFVRTDIPDRDFEPEKVLHVEETSNNWGVWWYRKQWYLKLKK